MGFRRADDRADGEQASAALGRRAGVPNEMFYVLWMACQRKVLPKDLPPIVRSQWHIPEPDVHDPHAGTKSARCSGAVTDPISFARDCCPFKHALDGFRNRTRKQLER